MLRITSPFTEPNPDLEGSDLGQEALSLTAGQSAVWVPGQNPTSPPSGEQAEISWGQQMVFFDANSLQLHIVTKRASTFTHKHYRYTITDTAVNNGWAKVADPVPGSGTSGHNWDQCMDPETGDYFFHTQVHNKIFWYDLSAGQWKETPVAPGSEPFVGGRAGACGGIAIHPDGLGAGRKTLFVFAQDAALGNGTIWYLEEPFDSGAWQSISAGFQISQHSQALYHAAQNAILQGGGKVGNGGDAPTQPLRKLVAGSAGAPGAFTAVGGSMPSVIGSKNLSVMLVDPVNAANLLIIERFTDLDVPGDKVWRSLNNGVSWSQIGTHNFDSFTLASTNTWACCGVPIPGAPIVVGLSSAPAGQWTWMNYRVPS